MIGTVGYFVYRIKRRIRLEAEEEIKKKKGL